MNENTHTLNSEQERLFEILVKDNQKSCISLIISIVVSTVLFMVTI